MSNDAVTGPVVVRIESCAYCPCVAERRRDELVCRHHDCPDGERVVVGEGYPPEWCPLREATE